MQERAGELGGNARLSVAPPAILQPVSDASASVRFSSMRGTLLAAAALLLGAACSSSPAAPTAALAVQESPSRLARLEERFPSHFGTRAYGIYFFGAKSGYLRESCRRDPLTDEILEESYDESSVVTEGVVEKSITETRSIYSSEPPHRLLFREEVTRENQGEERKVFNARGPVGKLGVFAGGESSVREGVRTDENLEGRLQAYRALAAGSPGARVAEFDLILQRDRMLSLVFVGKEQLEVAGAERELRHLKLSDGAKGAIDLFFDPKDILVLVKMADLLEFRLEDVHAAPGDVVPVAAFAKACIPLEGFEGDPATRRKLELEWSGAAELLPERAGQSSRWKEEARVQLVSTTRKSRPSKAKRALAVPDEVRVELQADSLCNSD